MKKISWFCVWVVLFITTGCFDTVDETTINDDGSGTFLSSVDMGKMLSALAAMGGDEKIKEAQKFQTDTTILIKDIKDSIGNLTDAEKKLVEKGTARLVMNMEKEKFSISFSIPFSKLSDILSINNVLKKSKGKIGKTLLEKIKPADVKDNNKDIGISEKEGEGTPDISAYFETSYEKNKLIRKVNKEKFAKVEEDESLKSLKEMSQMGMPLNFKTVFNLPKPAKKANGKSVTLSDDKKTVIIAGTLEDFFEDPSNFEYEIEY